MASLGTAAAASLRLSVLDQSPIAEGSTGGAALHHSVELARQADRLGYHRFWLAEHHQTPALACASPEAMIGQVAQATSSRLRVGSGGIMLPHYSPLKVAETFSMLAGMYPDRIDLGLGRAPGTDAPTAFALQRDRRQAAPDDFPEQLDELLAYLENRVPAGHPFARLTRLPGRPEAPVPFLLGSSPMSAIWAAERGLPYVFADFINSRGAALARHYRDAFVPTAHRLERPAVIVTAWSVCAETDEEAMQLASSFKMLMALLHRGQLIAVPPVERALRFLAEERVPLDDMPPGRRAIIGSPQTVRAGITALAREYGADEVQIVNIMHDHEARLRSYELIAEAFELSPAAASV
ncbi:MAG TPA: LLM class flavin-dependent oxidoreductase [Tepidisphaeraceae bacterium]|nr:LLM class flavin-dependent oxidoreductase [Tepidisphaeraceae bacterium]